jgi:hypothetical protein
MFACLTGQREYRMSLIFIIKNGGIGIEVNICVTVKSKVIGRENGSKGRFEESFGV